jgi:hypothetical protein
LRLENDVFSFLWLFILPVFKLGRVELFIEVYCPWYLSLVTPPAKAMVGMRTNVWVP